MIYLAAVTGVRRGELCAVRRTAIDWDRKTLRVDRSIFKEAGQKVEGPTKNRRRRTIAVDDRSLTIFRSHIETVDGWAISVGAEAPHDAYVFTDSPIGTEPWDPDMITQFFRRLRVRLGLEHIDFHSLRRFMDTYGQELGFSLAQVAVRAGHDPAVASRHYTGRVEEVDRALAKAMSDLLAGD